MCIYLEIQGKIYLWFTQLLWLPFHTQAVLFFYSVLGFKIKIVVTILCFSICSVILSCYSALDFVKTEIRFLGCFKSMRNWFWKEEYLVELTDLKPFFFFFFAQCVLGWILIVSHYLKIAGCSLWFSFTLHIKDN